MSTVKNAQGSRTQLSGASAALTSLASATYAVLGTITHNSGGKTPLDCLVEVYCKPGTVSSLKQLTIFAQKSLDGTNFESGPTSGTTTTDEPNLTYVGTVPLNSNTTSERRIFSLAQVFGSLPFATKLIAKNESGAALSATGTDNDCYTMDITGDIT
ncbi:MAG TPA: hypothetical protein VN663_14355 [Ramlibacter sp.]|nr:hypothetical protein [Ramlibacter sp.]